MARKMVMGNPFIIENEAVTSNHEKILKSNIQNEIGIPFSLSEK
jgi:hypothetical protein